MENDDNQEINNPFYQELEDTFNREQQLHHPYSSDDENIPQRDHSFN